MGISKYMTKENCLRLDLLEAWRELGNEIIDGKTICGQMPNKERKAALNALYLFVCKLLDEEPKEEQLDDA